jgi:hypothetical protein
MVAVLAGSQPLSAQSPKKNAVIQIPATVLSIQGSVKRMISYRDQNHAWQSSDNAIHLVVNLGSTPAGNGLALYSSFDNGNTWTQMFTLPQTDGASTDDGVLTPTATGATLQLVYNTSPNIGTIVYATANYDSSSNTWSAPITQTAFASPGIVASNPAFAADDVGNLWCAFTEENSAALQYQEELIYQAAGTQQWVDSGLILGTVDNTTQHSARPVPYTGGVGVIYEDENTLYWAYRLDSFAFTDPWVTTPVYVGLPPESSDPYDSHFSVVADSSNNLYLAFVSAPANLSFTAFTSSTNTWLAPETLASSTSSPAYPQVSIETDTETGAATLMLLANYETSVKVMQATTFSPSAKPPFITTQILTHTPAQSGSGISYGKPRVEAPRYSNSPMPVFQQFVNGTTEELMFFSVPVLN